MIPADVLAKLAVLGLAPAHASAVAAMLVDVEKATKEEASAAIEARRANDRDRKARQKHVNSREGTGRNVNAGNSPIRVSAPAEPKITNSSEPLKNKEEKIMPAEPARKGKTLCPLDFAPDETRLRGAAKAGLTSEEAWSLAETMRDWSHGKGERRQNWQFVYSTFVANAAKKRSERPPPKQRGPSFLDIANAAQDYLKKTDHDDTRPPYLRLAQ